MEKRFSFPRNERLCQSKDFERVYQAGRPLSNEYLSLYTLSTTNPYTRIGFSVSKKIGKSNQRNRVKRLLREIYRLNRPNLKGRVDIVVVARAKAVDLDFRSLEGCLLGLFRKANLLVE